MALEAMKHIVMRLIRAAEVTLTSPVIVDLWVEELPTIEIATGVEAEVAVRPQHHEGHRCRMLPWTLLKQNYWVSIPRQNHLSRPSNDLEVLPSQSDARPNLIRHIGKACILILEMM